MGVCRSAAPLLLALFLLMGCAAPPAALAPDASPEQVARRYYELHAAGREGAASSLTWRPTRFDTAVADTSLRGLTDLRVGHSREDTAVGRPSVYRELAALRMLVVRYEPRRTSVNGAPPRHEMRFVLLGQERPGGPWLVVETGTGP